MWNSQTPNFGDHIRVNRGFYYHHGIFAANNCVIHFASEEDSSVIDPLKAKIIVTSLEKFLNGGAVEVRLYSTEEQNKKRSPSDIVNYALMRVGEGLNTYNLISNNCEHFANECVFDKKESKQVEDVFSMLFGGVR